MGEKVIWFFSVQEIFYGWINRCMGQVDLKSVKIVHFSRLREFLMEFSHLCTVRSQVNSDCLCPDLELVSGLLRIIVCTIIEWLQ